MKRPYTFHYTLLKFLCVFAAITFLAGNTYAQSIVITTADPTTVVVGTTISATSTVTKPSGYTSVSVVYSLGSITLSPDVSSPYTDNISTSSLTPGTYTLTAVYNYKNSSNQPGTKTDQITVNLLPATPNTTDGSTACGGTTATLTASGSPTGGTYKWYTVSSGGTAISGVTGSTYSPTVSATKIYYVSYVYGGQESARNDVTATYKPAATSTFTPSASTVNTGTSVTFTYTGTDPASSTFNWNFDGGVLVSSSGNNRTVTWSVPGVHTVSLTVTNTSGCSSATTTTNVTVSAVTLAAYGFMKPIILYTSQITSGISSTLGNFPALVYIKDDALKIGANCGDKVQFPLGNGGGLTAGTNYDFAFTTPGSSTELNYQVDTYDSVNGILLAWVRIPSLTSTDVPLSFYFGSKTPAHSAAFSALTWWTDYKAVYHFNEASTSAAVLDATSNTRNAIQNNTTVTNDEIHIAAAVPIVGGGYSFNGTNTSIIQNAGSAPNINGAFTISAWVYYNGPSTSDNKIVSNELDYGHSNNSGGYKLSVKTGAIQTETRISGGTIVGNLGTGGGVDNTGWHYIQGTFNGSATGVFKNYVDGEPYSSVVMAKNETTMIPSNGFMLAMGLDHGTGTVNGGYNDEHFYNGKMDEVRVSNVEKTPDWIRAEYYNQTKPREFCDYAETVVSFQANAANLTGAVEYKWTGADSANPNDQTDADNWDAGYVPVFNGNTKLIIPVVSSGKYPVLTADASIYSLTIADGGAYFDLNGHTLNVGCNIYNNATTGGKGILNSLNTSSLINWNGSLTAQGYYGTNTAKIAELDNMTVNNSSAGTVTITGGPIDIFNTVTLTKGNLVIDNTGNGDMTLKSKSTLTASVAAIPSTYSITGNVNVERYISGGALKYRGYRFLSSPVYTVKSGSDYYYDLSYLMTEVPMTGTLGASGGMDKVGNPSVYLYRNDVMFTNGSFNGGNFRGINKINNTTKYQIGIDSDPGPYYLHVGTGFWMFYRGDKTNLASKFITNTVPEETALVSRGTLTQQAVTVVNWYTGLSTLQYSMMNGSSYAGYNLVGNPYASSIDWNTRGTTAGSGIYITNVSPTIYIYNESTKIYGTYNGSLGINGATNIIPSGQGFYVKATGTSAQLTFNEAGKTSTQYAGPTAATGNTLLLSTKPVRDTDPLLQYMRLQLFKDSDNIEESIVQFTETAKNEFVDGEDSEHMTGSGGVSFSSSSSDNIALAINLVPFPKTKTTVIRLSVDAAASGQYTINKTEFKNIPAIYDMWLKDAYKKDSLDIKNNSTYTFDILKTDTNSFGSHRFTLVIRENPALGLHLLNFAAAKTTSGSELVWKVENERYSTNFTVERSIDNGKTYSVLGGFASSDEGTYSFTDKKPIIAADTYRIKLEDLNGTITYSKAITLQYANVSDINNNAVNIYPNPAVGVINVAIVENSVNLTKSNNPSYSLKITNSSGKILKAVTTSQATWQDNVAALMPGTYVVDVTNNADNSMVGKAKFVKL